MTSQGILGGCTIHQGHWECESEKTRFIQKFSVGSPLTSRAVMAGESVMEAWAC